MAQVPVVTKTATTAISLNSILLATSGDTLSYVKGKSQELWLFNTSGNTVTVNIDGNSGTTVTIPGTAGTQVSVAEGLVISIPTNSFAYLPLDKAESFLLGQVSITASTGAVVRATVVQP